MEISMQQAAQPGRRFDVLPHLPLRQRKAQQAVSAAEAPVPVPATLALLGLGLLGVGARRKRLHVRA